MKKIKNNKQKMVIAGFEISSGINFLPQDFFSVLDSNNAEAKKWQKLIESGTIELLSE